MTERDRMRGTALVTGASGGIGLQLAECFAEAGFDLVLVARREAELEALAERCRNEQGVRATALPADLLAPDATARLVEALDAKGVVVDVLVNNAGLMEMGRFAEINVARSERLVQLNVSVLTSLTRHLLPAMIERGEGRILNVASTSAFQPVPGLGLYAASKAFVLSFSESLGEELKDTGVTVTALCPGFTETDMLESVKDAHPSTPSIPGFLVSDARDVAREGLEACLSGRPVVVPGLANRVGATLVQFYPRWLVRAVGGVVGRHSTS